jgi:hypothetical protein
MEAKRPSGGLALDCGRFAGWAMPGGTGELVLVGAGLVAESGRGTAGFPFRAAADRSVVRRTACEGPLLVRHTGDRATPEG